MQHPNHPITLQHIYGSMSATRG